MEDEAGPARNNDEDKDDKSEDESHDSGSHSSEDSDSGSDSGSSRSGSTVSTFSGSGSEQEDLRDYKRGGYHPLRPKDFLNNRYLIIRKLGWGHFSTVWMAFDQVDQDFKALKVNDKTGIFFTVFCPSFALLSFLVSHPINESSRVAYDVIHPVPLTHVVKSAQPCSRTSSLRSSLNFKRRLCRDS